MIAVIVLISLLANLLTGCSIISADQNIDDSVSSNTVNEGRDYAEEGSGTAKAETQEKEQGKKGIISSIVGKVVMAPECREVSISLLEISGKKELCISKNTLNIGIINDGEIALKGIDLYTDSKIAGELVTQIRSGVGVGSTARQYARYNEENLGKLKRVVIVPVIIVDGEETSCDEKAISEDIIEVCS